jgi:hypothetical protein
VGVPVSLDPEILFAMGLDASGLSRHLELQQAADRRQEIMDLEARLPLLAEARDRLKRRASSLRFVDPLQAVKLVHEVEQIELEIRRVMREIEDLEDLDRPRLSFRRP